MLSFFARLARPGLIAAAVVSTLRCAAGGHTPPTTNSAGDAAASNATPSAGQLRFAPHAPVRAVATGMTALRLGGARDGFLYVPITNDAKHLQPLLVLLHGATQRAQLFERVMPVAESLGVVLVVPESRGTTWDAIRGDFGPDVEFIDSAIMRAFDRAYIDKCKVAIGGFSDGASYALSLGVRNANLVHGAVAFSPGFLIPPTRMQVLPVFIRHGTQDDILPIDRASRSLVSTLRSAGFDVNYREFNGPHMMRTQDVHSAMEWTTELRCPI